jgi:hypothetical protein
MQIKKPSNSKNATLKVGLIDLTQNKISPQNVNRKNVNKTNTSITSIRAGGVRRPATTQSPKAMTPLNNKLGGIIALTNPKKKIPVVTLSGLASKANALPKTKLKINLPSTGESP